MTKGREHWQTEKQRFRYCQNIFGNEICRMAARADHRRFEQAQNKIGADAGQRRQMQGHRKR